MHLFRKIFTLLQETWCGTVLVCKSAVKLGNDGLESYWVKYFDMNQWMMLTASSVLFSYNPSLFALHFFSCAVARERKSGCQSWGGWALAGVAWPTTCLCADVAVMGTQWPGGSQIQGIQKLCHYLFCSFLLKVFLFHEVMIVVRISPP